MKSFRDSLLETTESYERKALKEALDLIEDVITKAQRYSALINKQGPSIALVDDGKFIGRLTVAADILKTELMHKKIS